MSKIPTCQITGRLDYFTFNNSTSISQSIKIPKKISSHDSFGLLLEWLEREDSFTAHIIVTIFFVLIIIYLIGQILRFFYF